MAKFREIIPTNRSPKIENIVIHKDTMFLATSESLWAFNLNTNVIEEVEFTKK